jgi:hypothetical protein
MKLDELLTQKYRAVLFSQVGMEVLADIMVNLCHFGQYHDAGNAEQDGAYNVGIKIMSRLGIFNPGTDLFQLFNAFTAVYPQKKEE